MALDLEALLKQQNVPKMGTKERIQYIGLDMLHSDERNFYELSGIDQLAANIELIGLQQPIRVREDGDGFRIVSGHRRHAALKKLAEEGKEEFQTVACIVETVDCSPAMQELRLIYANSDTRKMSSADLSRQAERVEALLYQLKEEGFEFPGRMRDHVAQACQTSKSKLSRLKVIREKLAEPWKPFYERGEVKENAAYALAQLSDEWQRKIYAEVEKKNNGLRYLCQGDVDRAAGYLEKLEAFECPQGGRCENADGKFKHMMGAAYCYDRCENKCCADCENLGSCKYACKKLSDRVAQIKAERKAKKEQEAQKKAAENEPKIARITDLWARFGGARLSAQVSVKDYLEGIGVYYTATDDGRYDALERGEGISADTRLPYGYSFDLTDAKRLIAAADMLDVSLDYLFCRTNTPSIPKLPEGQLVFNGWMPGGTTPHDPCDAVVVFELGERSIKRICRWTGTHWAFERGGANIEATAIKWMALPPEEDA